jgi:hypothetical protein
MMDQSPDATAARWAYLGYQQRIDEAVVRRAPRWLWVRGRHRDWQTLRGEVIAEAYIRGDFQWPVPDGGTR